MTLAYFDSWDTLEGSLHGRFVAGKKKGGRRVAEGRYLLQYLDTGDEIDRGMSWNAAIRPGHRMTMSLICELAAEEKDETKTLKCPSCKTLCEDTPGKTVRCSSCGSLLQRLDLFHYDEDAPEAPDAPDSHGTFDAAKVADKAHSGNVGPSNPLGPNHSSSRGGGRRKYPRRKPASGSGEDMSDEENMEGIKNIAVAHVARSPSHSSAKVQCTADGDDKTPAEWPISTKDKKKAKWKEDAPTPSRQYDGYTMERPTRAVFREGHSVAPAGPSYHHEGLSYGGYYPHSSSGNYTTSSSLTRKTVSNSKPKRGQRIPYSYYRPDSPDSDDNHDEYVTTNGVTFIISASSRPEGHAGAYHKGPRHDSFARYYDSSSYAGRDTRYQRSPLHMAGPGRPTSPGSRKATAPSITQTRNQPEFPAQRTATAEDATKHGIPRGYSLKNWDPDEEPITVAGSVFDANSLGTWIYNWAVAVHGASTPLSDLAGDLWLSLLNVAGKTRCSEEVLPNIRSEDEHEMVEDFIASAKRLMDKLRRILKICEQPMLKQLDKKGPGSSKAAGRAFIETMFGREAQLEAVEKLKASMQLWNNRFDLHCKEIVRNPAGAKPQAPRARAEKEPARDGDGPEGAGASSVAAQAGSDVGDERTDENDGEATDTRDEEAEDGNEDEGREKVVDGGDHTDELDGDENGEEIHSSRLASLPPSPLEVLRTGLLNTLHLFGIEA